MEWLFRDQCIALASLHCERSHINDQIGSILKLTVYCTFFTHYCLLCISHKMFDALAGDVLDAAGRILGEVFRFAANVAAYVVGNLVNLQEVELSAGLSTARGGHFRARVKSIIVGIGVNFGISLYFYDPQA